MASTLSYVVQVATLPWFSGTVEKHNFKDEVFNMVKGPIFSFFAIYSIIPILGVLIFRKL